jgi:hypothetical protein
LTRTNTVDLHPVWFAIYGDVVYHHGAGFRTGWTLDDLERSPAGFVERLAGRFSARSKAAGRVHNHLRWRRKQRVGVDHQRTGDQMFGRLRRDPQFWRQLVDERSDLIA